MKHFQRVYLRPFPGQNALALLYLVNIQPNSKLHPPTTKTFRICFWIVQYFLTSWSEFWEDKFK